MLVCDHNLTDCGTESIVNWVEARHPTQRTMLPNLRFARYRFTNTCHSHTNTCTTDGNIERKCDTSIPGTEWSTSSLVCADDSVDTCYERTQACTYGTWTDEGSCVKSKTNSTLASCSASNNGKQKQTRAKTSGPSTCTDTEQWVDCKGTRCTSGTCTSGSCCTYGNWYNVGNCLTAADSGTKAFCSATNNGKIKQRKLTILGPIKCISLAPIHG